MLREIEFKNWCERIRTNFDQAFNFQPNKNPNLAELHSIVSERMMRCGLEARYFGIEDGWDDLAILAHHTLLRDDLRHGLSRPNDLSCLYGYREKSGTL